MLKIILFDRDNTLVCMPPGVRYLSGGDALQFCPGAPEAIRLLNTAGIRTAVITNQRAVALAAYPHITRESVQCFHERIQQRLHMAGAKIDAFYFCPHDDEDNCACRKPKPGLIMHALHDFSIGPAEAVLIGDSQRDIMAAQCAGVAGIRFDPATQNLSEIINDLLKDINQTQF